MMTEAQIKDLRREIKQGIVNAKLGRSQTPIEVWIAQKRVVDFILDIEDEVKD